MTVFRVLKSNRFFVLDVPNASAREQKTSQTSLSSKVVKNEITNLTMATPPAFLSEQSTAILCDIEGQKSRLQMLSRIGIQDAGAQTLLRTKAATIVAELRALEGHLAAQRPALCLGGDAYGSEDTALASRLRTLLTLVLRPEWRQEFSLVSKWFDAYLQQEKGDDETMHWLGKSRIGDQIDMRPKSLEVAAAAMAAFELNKGVKKAESQRQKEKRLKQQKKKQPAGTSKPAAAAAQSASPEFLFGDSRVTFDAGKVARRAALDAAMKHVTLQDPDQVAIVEHGVATTVKEMLDHLKNESGGKCKNLFLKFSKKKSRTIKDDTGLWLVSALHDTVINTKHLSKHLGYPKELRMGRPDVLKASLELVKGECSPFALINDPDKQVQVVLDAAMMKEKKLWFHPLTNTATMSITPRDLLAFIARSGRQPRIVDFSSLG